ncbi:BRO-N domain-containing protein [Azotobacter salinestris]|uniref:BRO-N domain-containing protein n=1 Tax=Azotobacter salinestris TaxID=69964 RepID=UPI00244E4356|nr:BRO family protein [Azotobacter salinestris]
MAKDVAEVLGYANTADAIAKHCKATNTIAIRDGKRGNPNQTIIPERDLYRLVMKSQLLSAERFEEWVVAEVLPSICKTGAYVMPGAQPATGSGRGTCPAPHRTSGAGRDRPRLPPRPA